MKEELETLTIYMKSGNRVEIPNVIDWRVSDNGKQVTELVVQVKEGSKGELPIMASCQLNQIELITKKLQ